MNREREAWQTIKDNATSDYPHVQVYDVTPVTKPNYITATVWTTIVAVLVCAVFSGFMLYLYNESNIEGTLTKAVNEAIVSLEQTIELQSKEIQVLKEENKKIYKHLQLWTPMDLQNLRRKYERRNKKPTEEDLWYIGPDIILRDFELPTHEPSSENICQEGVLCLPLLQSY